VAVSSHILLLWIRSAFPLYQTVLSHSHRVPEVSRFLQWNESVDFRHITTFLWRDRGLDEVHRQIGSVPCVSSLGVVLINLSCVYGECCHYAVNRLVMSKLLDAFEFLNLLPAIYSACGFACQWSRHRRPGFRLLGVRCKLRLASKSNSPA
jgi:hypothetical protein